MPEILRGEDTVLFFRKYADRTKVAAERLKLQVEHSISFEKDKEAVKTKDGTFNVVTDGENTMDITSIAYVDDNGTATVWENLEEWFKAKELVEIWEVNLSQPGSTSGKYKTSYFQGYITSFSISAPHGDKRELSMSYAINADGAKGQATLTKGQIDTLKEAGYGFRDITTATN